MVSPMVIVYSVEVKQEDFVMKKWIITLSEYLVDRSDTKSIELLEIGKKQSPLLKW